MTQQIIPIWDVYHYKSFVGAHIKLWLAVRVFRTVFLESLVPLRFLRWLNPYWPLS